MIFRSTVLLALTLISSLGSTQGLSTTGYTNMEEPDQSYEVVLLNKPLVKLFKIPPRPTLGHRAESWKECFWRGKLQIVTKSDCCTLKFIDGDTGDLFAKCPLPEKYEQACERTIDSSRFFAVRLDGEKGRHVFVGMGFDDRNDAFDVVCALADFSRKLEMDSKGENTAADVDTSKIHALKEGEKITVKFKGLKSKSGDKQSKNLSTPVITEKFTGLLPPPPSHSTNPRSSFLGHEATLSSSVSGKKFNDLL